MNCDKKSNDRDKERYIPHFGNSHGTVYYLINIVMGLKLLKKLY